MVGYIMTTRQVESKETQRLRGNADRSNSGRTAAAAKMAGVATPAAANGIETPNLWKRAPTRSSKSNSYISTALQTPSKAPLPNNPRPPNQCPPQKALHPQPKMATQPASPVGPATSPANGAPGSGVAGPAPRTDAAVVISPARREVALRGTEEEDTPEMPPGSHQHQAKDWEIGDDVKMGLG